MSLLAWTLAGVGAALAGTAAVADGALLSEVVPPTQGPSLLPLRSSVAGERMHRALAFARVVGQLAAGAGVATALDLADQPSTNAAILVLVLGLFVVLGTESVARGIGDGVGSHIAKPIALLAIAIERLLRPAVRIGDWLDRLFAEITPEDDTPQERREEAAAQFREVVNTEAEVTRDERDLLLSVFDFGETTAEEVMMPRVDMFAVERETPWSELLDRIRSAEHSRIPVYDETIDEIVGILYVKDLLPAVLADEEPDAGWPSLMRPPTFIPASKRIADLLKEFRQTRRHIAIVADEYGGTAGLVTIEDVIEELVGEIRDEYDDEERPVESEEGLRFWVPGRMTLDDLSETLGYEFNREDVSTVGGLILELLGRVPRAGEALRVGPFKVIVEQVKRRKIERVYWERIEVVVEDSSEDEGTQ